jgi:hypothetical protein
VRQPTLGGVPTHKRTSAGAAKANLPKGGFKAEAEREAARVRKELGLASHDRLDPRELANHLDVSVVDAGELVDVAELEELERLQAFAFSAATFEIDDRKIIVVSPLRNTGRQNSDIAHELAHVMLEHRWRCRCRG